MKQTSPVVSVIIPTYNSVATIIQAIESVFNQSYTSHEVIVVDDGSTDATRQMLAPYTEMGRITYLFQENKGCGAARNNGAEHAKGELLAFLDADDYWHEKKLEEQVAVFHKHPACVLCYTDAYEVDPFQAVIWDVRQTGAGKLRSGKVLMHLVLRNFITLSSATVRKDIFDKVGGFVSDRNLMMFADYDLWLKVAPLGDFEAVKNPLVFYQTRLPISRVEKMSNHAKVAQVFLNNLRASRASFKIWYLGGYLMSQIKWAGNALLRMFHL
jgi:glycosyltransferase involved in cell wall biosynthesis